MPKTMRKNSLIPKYVAELRHPPLRSMCFRDFRGHPLDVDLRVSFAHVNDKEIRTVIPFSDDVISGLVYEHLRTPGRFGPFWPPWAMRSVCVHMKIENCKNNNDVPIDARTSNQQAEIGKTNSN